MRGFGGSYFYTSPSNFARAVTFASDITANGHIQLANDKQIKHGVDGFAVWYDTANQTADAGMIAAPSSQIIRIIDKDRTGDYGSLSVSHPTVVFHQDAAPGSAYAYLSQAGSGMLILSPGSTVAVVGSTGVSLSNGTGSNLRHLLGKTNLPGYATGSLPTAALGDIVFDTTTNKVKIGGAGPAYETVTSA